MNKELLRTLFLLTLMICFTVFIFGCVTVIEEKEESEMEKILKKAVKIDTVYVTGVTNWFEEINKGMIDGEYQQYMYLDENGDTIARRYVYGKIQYFNYDKWLKDANEFNAKVEVSPNPTSSFLTITLKNISKFPISFKYKLVFDEKVIYNFENPNCFGTEQIPENILQKDGVYRILYTVNDGNMQKENIVSFWVQKK